MHSNTCSEGPAARQTAGVHYAPTGLGRHGVGDTLERGELYGMIKFGSRTELWLPANHPHVVKVKVGDRVKCGETVLVQLVKPA